MGRRFTAPELILLVVGTMIILWLIGMPLIFQGVPIPADHGIFGNWALNGLNPWALIIVVLVVFVMALFFSWDFDISSEKMPSKPTFRTMKFLKLFSWLVLVIAVLVALTWPPYIQFKSKGRRKINGTPAWTRQ